MHTLLVLNAGSSSLKFALFQTSDGGDPELRVRGNARARGDQLEFSASDTGGHLEASSVSDERYTPALALARVMAWLDAENLAGALTAVGHRVVHGGDHFPHPVLVTPEHRHIIEALGDLAPLHQPFSLACIDAVTEHYPDLPQVACFDTSFHQTISPVARVQALPEDLKSDSLRRYGFHGLSYESVAVTTASMLSANQRHRMVVAHLGGGASLCALHHGHSIDTTMGFTPLDGLVMGTRPGGIDAGLILHVLKTHQLSAESLEDALYHRAGLLGISGTSSDMQTLLASSEPDAVLAVDYFVYRVIREIGAMAAVLGGIDTLVFTGGIGEHSAEIRQRVAEGCAWLGATLDKSANDRHATWLTSHKSAVAVLCINTDEERMIARHTLAVLADPTHG